MQFWNFYFLFIKTLQFRPSWCLKTSFQGLLRCLLGIQSDFFGNCLFGPYSTESIAKLRACPNSPKNRKSILLNCTLYTVCSLFRKLAFSSLMQAKTGLPFASFNGQILFWCMLGLFTLSVPPHPPISLMKKFQGWEDHSRRLGGVAFTLYLGGWRRWRLLSTYKARLMAIKSSPCTYLDFIWGAKTGYPGILGIPLSTVQPPIPPAQTLLRNR